MQTRPVPPGGAKETGAMVEGGKDAEWREALRWHADSLWRGHGGDPKARGALTQRLGPLADDVLQIVEDYARGARSRENFSDRSDAFETRLELILNGIEATLGSIKPDEPISDAPPHMIQSELWQLLRKVRESADLAYSREQYLIELDRRILLLLQDRDAMVPADISSAVGVDKAQVSRSVKRLLELRLVERDQIRAPLHLTRDGERLGRRLNRMAELRNRELTIDISDDELSEFYDTIEILLDRAVALYEQERSLAQGSARGKDDQSNGLANERESVVEKIAIDRSRVVAPLMTLSSYFSRSGSLAFKRLTGLSSFEAFVLSEIGMNPPIEWGALVSGLARDHSQAGRTINSLMERGLIVREGKPGRRHGRFRPSSDGFRLHAVIHEAGRQRSAFLLSPLAADQRTRFLATFDKIRRNAIAQLERERAFAELDRP